MRCRFVPTELLHCRGCRPGRHRPAGRSGRKGRAPSRRFTPFNGLHMLPNLKFLIGGVVFGLLLFAVTGAGVTLPDSYTRVGAPPEIGRPMMQGMIAGEPAKAQLYAMAASRRNEELQRLRERDLFRDL